MFQSKIQARSEIELKDYFAKWLKEVERLGLLDPKTYQAKRENKVRSPLKIE